MIPIDKIANIEAALKKYLSLFKLAVMLYWRYFKPYKNVFIYLSVYKGYDVPVAYYTAWYCNKKEIYDWIEYLKTKSNE